MFSHYFFSALRQFRQHRLTTAINITCLAIGLTCFFGAHWLITASRTADSYQPQATRTYVLTQTTGSRESVSLERAVSAYVATDFLKAEYPALIVARGTDGSETGETLTAAVAGDNSAFVHVRYADADFTRVFELPWLAGDGQALAQPNSVIITREAATRLFGSWQHAVGKIIRLRNRDDVTVTGVIDTIRSPSHLAAGSQYQFDLLVSMSVYAGRAKSDTRRAAALTSWRFTDVLTYIVVPQNSGIDSGALAVSLRSFAERHMSAAEAREVRFGLLPVTGLNMDTALNVAAASASLASGLYLLGGLVLFISCLNYANLATAQAAMRAKEVGMRRIVGARRSQIMLQHFIESGLAAASALLLALTMVVVTLAFLRPAGALFIAQRMFSDSSVWIFLLCVWSGVTLAAGLYPAFVLSGIRPVRAVNVGQRGGTGRRAPIVLVSAQFVAASFLVTVLFVIGKHNSALQASALDAMSDPVIVLRNNIRDAGVSFDVLRTELLRKPHIRAVTGSQRAPWSSGMSTAGLTRTAETSAAVIPSNLELVNYDYFDALGLELMAGRMFNRSQASDDSTLMASDMGAAFNVVIDDALAADLGWQDAQVAVGKTVFRRAGTGNDVRPLYIVGVVKNRSLNIAGSRSLFILDPAEALLPSVRIDRKDIPAALEEIDTVWKRLAPAMPLNRQFADEVWDETYVYLRMLTGGLAAIAGLAFVNALLGLIGMSMHVINRRMREIGLRKTLGASATRVLGMLMRDSSKPVVIGNLIALPLAILAANAYLSVFTMRSGFSILPFLGSLIVTVLVACFAIFAQATRAARLRPAVVLRYE